MSTKNNLPEDGFGREFIITREFDAPRELVFDAHSGENEDDPGQLVTTVTFDDQAGKMKLTLRALFRSATKPSKNTTPSRKPNPQSRRRTFAEDGFSRAAWPTWLLKHRFVTAILCRWTLVLFTE